MTSEFVHDFVMFCAYVGGAAGFFILGAQWQMGRQVRRSQAPYKLDPPPTPPNGGTRIRVLTEEPIDPVYDPRVWDRSKYDADIQRRLRRFAARNTNGRQEAA